MDAQQHKTVFFDLETAGLDPKRHPFIQLAALAVDADLQPLEAFEVKIRFSEAQAAKASLRKNHYRRGLWAQEALAPLDAARRFAEFLARHATCRAISSQGQAYSVAQLVAHNAAFDGPFLQTWHKRLKVFLPARFQVLCTMQRALWLFAEHPEIDPPQNFKLATLCEYFDVPFHAADAHAALGDVTATFLLYKAMRDRGLLADSLGKAA